MKKIKDHNHNISRNIIHENVSLLIITTITISNPTTNSTTNSNTTNSNTNTNSSLKSATIST